MKVNAIFCDYDGTLAPLGVPRSRSRVPMSLSKILFMIHERIPVAIVTAKDYQFVSSRTPFADAWSCVYGIETIVRGGTKRVVRPRGDLTAALAIVEAIRPHAFIEYKRTSAGELCGFCAEWKPDARPRNEEIHNATRKIEVLGFKVLHSSFYPMFDVVSSEGDKGMAVTILQKILRTNLGVMFIGDSPDDNPGFAVADVSIGVVGEGSGQGLECNYFVGNSHLAQFLRALLVNDLNFSEQLPWVVRREETN